MANAALHSVDILGEMASAVGPCDVAVVVYLDFDPGVPWDATMSARLAYLLNTVSRAGRHQIHFHGRTGAPPGAEGLQTVTAFAGAAYRKVYHVRAKVHEPPNSGLHTASIGFMKIGYGNNFSASLWYGSFKWHYFVHYPTATPATVLDDWRKLGAYGVAHEALHAVGAAHSANPSHIMHGLRLDWRTLVPYVSVETSDKIYNRLD